MRTPLRLRLPLARLGVLVAALLLAATRPTMAQQTAADQVVDRQLAYDAARSQYDAAVGARAVLEKQWSDALEEHEQARRSNDATRQNAALVRALDLSRELDLADKRTTQERKRLETARSSLGVVIDTRMEELSGQLSTARSTTERTSFAKLLRDLDNQQRQLEADRDALKVQVVSYQSIQFDVRDTPEIMTGKAQLLRAKAQRDDSALVQIDREIARIDQQLRRTRNVQSLISGVERFGDVQPPGGAPGRRNPQGDVPARPDSAGVSRPEVSLQEQIQQLRLLRGQVERAKSDLLQRAGDFEKAARRIG